MITRPDIILRKDGITPGNTNGHFGEIAKWAANYAAGWPDISEIDLLDAVRWHFGDWISQRLSLRKRPKPYAVFGAGFEPKTLEQMDTTMRLPVAVGGALMPDGHPGYGLPIGGVAALYNAVAPNLVGVDIACRVTASIYAPSREDTIEKALPWLFATLKKVTHFGLGAASFADGVERDHPVMYDPLWQTHPVLKNYYDLAYSQLGSSGGGNHFADILIGEVLEETEWLGLPKGRGFLVLLTHSGSRGTGAKIAAHYSKLAVQETKSVADVPADYSWLGLDTEAGLEYWQAMSLMGDYAQANHHLIHSHFQYQTGLIPYVIPGGTVVDLNTMSDPLTVLENHHNFAWIYDDNDTVLHRKGATPAAYGQPGLIPGTSGTFSYMVEGLGSSSAYDSASHGAGRPFSRTEAKRRHTNKIMQHYHDKGILVDGLAPDETLAAYKDIELVMLEQSNLVKPVVKMTPLAVLMGGRSDDGD